MRKIANMEVFMPMVAKQKEVFISILSSERPTIFFTRESMTLLIVAQLCDE
jgi:hypothetical protein